MGSVIKRALGREPRGGANQEGALVDGRFRVLHRLGSDHRGGVWLTEDNSSGDPVVLKFIEVDTGRRSLDSVFRFKKEAELYRQLAHPGIARILEVGTHGQAIFVATEYVDGVSLDRFLRAEQSLSLDRFFSVSKRLTATLGAIHEKQLVHGDLRPTNIILREEQGGVAVTLLGCGVSVHSLRAGGAAERSLGSYAFMSPERFGFYGGGVDARSDVYSLGIVLYLMLTSRPPYSASSVYALMQQHIASEPPSISALNPNVPAVLESIILKAMAKAAESRYGSALELAADLEELEQRLARGDTGLFPLGTNGGKSPKRAAQQVIGREAELDQLMEHVERARLGAGGVVFIRGEPGVGKTRLAEALHERLISSGGVMVSSDCRESGENQPYGAILACVDKFFELVGYFSATRREVLIRDTVAIIGNLASLLVEHLPSFPWDTSNLVPCEILKEDEERRRFEDLLFRVMVRLAEDCEGCVFLLDNLQWADRASKGFIERLSESASPRRFIVLCCERRGEGDSEVLEPEQPNTTVIVLEPFSEELTRRLVSDLANLDSKTVDRVAGWIQGITGGNAFYSIELVRHLGQGGGLAELDCDAEELFHAVPLSEGIATVIIESIASYDDLQRRILCSLAVLGKTATFAEAFSCLSDDSEDDLLRTINRARQEGVMVVRGERVSFTHDLLQQHLYQLLEPEARRRVHERAARYHEGLAAEDDDEAVFRCARHWARSGQPRQAIERLVEAGHLAARRHSSMDAIDYFREALELEGELPKSGRARGFHLEALAGLARAYGDSGNHEQALRLVEEGLTLERRPLERAELHELAGTVLMESGDYEEAIERLLKGLAELGERRQHFLPAGVMAAVTRYLVTPPWIRVDQALISRAVDELTAHKMSIYEKLALISFWKGKSALLMHSHFTSLALVDKLGASEVSLRILCIHAALLISAPWPPALSATVTQRITKTLDSAKKLRDAIGSESSASCFFDACYAAHLVFSEGEVIQGRDLIQSTMVNYWKLRTTRNLQEISSIASQVFEAACDFEGLREVTERTRELGLLFENPLILAYSKTYAGMSSHYRGADEEAESTLREAIQVFEDKDDKVFRVIAGKYLIKVLFARGEATKGEALYQELVAFSKANTIAHPAISAMHGYPIEARLLDALRSGATIELEEAGRQIAKLTKEVAAFPFLQPLLERTQLLECALSGDRVGRERAFREGTALAAAKTGRYEAGLFDYYHGLSIRREEPQLARRELEQALFAFDEGGAWREKRAVRDELDELDGRTVWSGGDEERASHRIVQELESIIRIGKRIGQIHELEPLLEEIVSSAVELAGADLGELFLYEGSNLVSKVRVALDASIPACSGVVSKVDFSFEPVVIRDAQRNELLKNDPQVVRHRLRSIACLPLAAREERIGILYLSNRQVAHLFGEHELDLLIALAGEVAIAIENTILLRQTRALQARLEGIVDSMPIAIVAAGVNGEVLLANSAAQQLFPELDGVEYTAVFWEVVPELQRFREAFGRVVGEQINLDFPKIEIGSATFQVSVFPLQSDGVEGGVLKLNDITEDLRLHEEIRQVQKLESIGQLAGGVAHDFNNLLVGIIGSAELLSLELPLKGEHREYLDSIIETSGRAATLTNQLLAFSRKGKTVSTPIDAQEPLNAAIELLQRTIDKRIEINADFRAKDPIVTGDPVQLQNAFLNLGINARDAMPEGGLIRIETRNVVIGGTHEAHRLRDLELGEYLEITISDNGTGIAPEVMEHIFEPFFTTKETGKGTGLGLAAVYGTINDHQGDISVESTVGEGTRFTCLLPCGSGHAPVDLSSTEPVVVGSGTILVVDDESVIRSTASSLLQSIGYQVLLARDGEEAIEIFRRDQSCISLVILDLVMPKISGHETFTRLREIRADIPVLISSGFSSGGGIQQMLDQGAAGLIQKPYRLSELSRAIDAALP